MAGIVSGAYLSRAGFEVHVYDRNKQIGGITGGYEKNGFHFDMGQLNIEGLGPGERAGKVIDELCIRDRLRLIPVARGYAFPDFSIIYPENYKGPWWREDALISMFPKEKRGIISYYQYYRRMREIVTFAERAEDSHGLRALLFKARMYLRLIPLLPKAQWSAQQLMDRYFTDPKLKAVFTSILADFVVKPEEFQGLGIALVNPETAFDSRVPTELSPIARQPSYCCIDGGCRVLINLLADVIRQNGGQIHTGVKVVAIRTSDGKVTGIDLEDRVFREAQIVLASGGAKETLQLFDSVELDAEFRNAMEYVPLMESVFMIHLVTDLNPAEYLRSSVNYCYRSYDIAGSVERLKNGIYHEGEDGYLIYAPTIDMPTLALDNHYAMTIYTVAPNRVKEREWKECKDFYADRLLDFASEKIPALREHILDKTVFTPEDFRAITSQIHHSFGGCAPVMHQKSIPNQTPIKGFWFIGSQSESGAGIVNVMAGARKVSKRIIDEFYPVISWL